MPAWGFIHAALLSRYLTPFPNILTPTRHKF